MAWKPRIALCLLACLLVGAARTEPVKIGALTDSWGITPAIVGLRDGLIALGYRDGEHFVIGTRFTQGDLKALAGAARDLLRAGSEILFVSGTNAAKAAQSATTSTPIVFAEAVHDPVAAGLVKSLNKPGGNITGVNDMFEELGPKRLELFKAIWPGLKRVVLIYDAAEAPSLAEALRQAREAARQLGIGIVERPVRTEPEARAALTAVRKNEEGLMAIATVSMNISGMVLDATSRPGIPTMFPGVYWAERGALASYGPDFIESGRQAARMVDKIIKGQKPADIPVETNSRIDLVINLKVANDYARMLGLTFPLARDEAGTVGRTYGVVGLPTTFVIARDGRAIARAVGPREWANDTARTFVRSLLAEPRSQ